MTSDSQKDQDVLGPTPQKIVDSTIMTATARVSMVLSIPLIIFVYSLYQSNLELKLANLKNDIRDQLIQEQRLALSVIQTDTATKIDKLSDSIQSLANSVNQQSNTIATIIERLRFTDNDNRQLPLLERRTMQPPRELQTENPRGRH